MTRMIMVMMLLGLAGLPACRPYHIAKSELERMAAEAEAKLLADLEVQRQEEAAEAQRVAEQQRVAAAQQAADEQRRVEQQRVAQQREAERQAEERRLAAERERQAAAAAAAARPSAAATPSSAQSTGAAMAPGGACVGEAVEFGGETKYAVRPQQIDGVTLAGLYRYTDHPTGRPRVELHANGTGVYELWGASAGPGHDRPGEWWVLGDCAGKPTATQTGPGGSAYVLMMRASTTTRFFQAGAVDFYQLIIAKDGSAHVNGERVKGS